MSVIACSKVIFSFPQVNSAVVFSQDLRSRCSNVRARSEPLKQRLISGLSLTCESRSMVDFWILRRIHSVNAPQAGPRWLLLEEEGGGSWGTERRLPQRWLTFSIQPVNRGGSSHACFVLLKALFFGNPSPFVNALRAAPGGWAG